MRSARQWNGVVREAISQARMLARGLSPVVLESAGLMSALQEMAMNAEQIHRIRCHLPLARGSAVDAPAQALDSPNAPPAPISSILHA